MKKKLLERYFCHTSWMSDILVGLLQFRPTTDLDTVLGLWVEMGRRHRQPLTGGGMQVIEGLAAMGELTYERTSAEDLDLTIKYRGKSDHLLPIWLLADIRQSLRVVDEKTERIRKSRDRKSAEE